jgi:tetratricopeptide (TPR) repeat protein
MFPIEPTTCPPLLAKLSGGPTADTAAASRRGARRALAAACCLALALISATAAAESETAPQPRPAATELGATPMARQPTGEPPAATATGEGSVATLEEVLGEVTDPLDQVERQIAAQEYDYAIDWLEQRIDQVQNESHRFDPRLVRPLTLLGDAHAGRGEYGRALELYQRALHLNRVNAGLNSPEQVEIVYREANVFKALGDFQRANDREEYAYHVLTRAHDPMDEALLPGLYHLARWYERTSNVFAARALYEHAIEIIGENGKLDTPSAIPALRGVASTYRMERFPPFYVSDLGESQTGIVTTTMDQPISINNFPAGEAALQKVVKIRQAEPDADPATVAEAVLELADWYTLFDKRQRAEPLYAHAWELMKQADSVDAVAFFGEPALLYFPAPENPSPPPSGQRGARTTGYVEVAFDVTEEGYVRDLTTVASEPDGLMDFRVRKSLRVARYRPMLVEGVPVAKEAHTYRHEFPYYEELEEEPVDGVGATASSG